MHLSVMYISELHSEVQAGQDCIGTNMFSPMSCSFVPVYYTW